MICALHYFMMQELQHFGLDNNTQTDLKSYVALLMLFKDCVSSTFYHAFHHFFYISMMFENHSKSLI